MTLITALAAHLRLALSSLHLAGPDGTPAPVKVFVGDLPAKTADKPFPGLILVPVDGYHDSDGGDHITIAIIAGLIGTDEDDVNGAEIAETDLTALRINIARCLLPCATTAPLQDRFVLLPDDKGRFLSWEKAEGQARPYCQAVITSHWLSHGWE